MSAWWLSQPFVLSNFSTIYQKTSKPCSKLKSNLFSDNWKLVTVINGDARKWKLFYVCVSLSGIVSALGSKIAAVSCAFKRWIVYFKFCYCPLRLYFVIRFVNCNFPSRFNYPLVLNLPGNFSIFDFVIQFKCTAFKSKFHLLFSHQFSLLCWAHFTKRLKRIFRHCACHWTEALPPLIPPTLTRPNKFETIYLWYQAIVFFGRALQRNKLTHFLIVYKFWASHAGPAPPLCPCLGPT